jgi:hypothetical protein
MEEETKRLMEEHEIDEDTAEKAQELIDDGHGMVKKNSQKILCLLFLT